MLITDSYMLLQNRFCPQLNLHKNVYFQKCLALSMVLRIKTAYKWGLTCPHHQHNDRPDWITAPVHFRRWHIPFFYEGVCSHTGLSTWSLHSQQLDGILSWDVSPGILIFNFCLSNIKLYFKREESLHSLYFFYKYMGFLQHGTSLFIFSEFNIVCLDAFYPHHYFLLEQVLLKPDLTQHSTTIWEREPKYQENSRNE